ncbi:cytochrome P450 [Natrarchaeobius chitinivorans]|uniref:Cytochrome P450 n=1 Tax=Natrarchaeobius chitinivorans TaxID=1679083 RepID=A0A3N6LZZ8_NATCH|nr:cytochrome P450 [Natrarchaeobius chitinivorans]RQG94847.1 cytochrome P450 [Natrarchaeobius chitinivorans]
MSTQDCPPAVGTVSEYDENPFRRLEQWGEHGDVVRITGSETDRHVLSHPSDIERMFFEHQDILEKHMVGQTSVATKSVGSVYGDQWRAQRSVQQPYFGPDRVRSNCSTFGEIARNVVDEVVTGERIDVHELMRRTAVRVILRTIFGDEHVSDDILECSAPIVDWHEAKAADGEIPPEITDRFESAHATLVDRIDTLIEKRRRSDDAGKLDDDGGLIPVLLAAGPDSDAQYTTDRIRDEMLAKFFSAHRTTSELWTYCLYTIATSPDIERECLAELESVAPDGRLGAQHVDELEYVERVLREVLRLYPPAPVLSRQLSADVSLDEYTLPAGDVVYFPAITVHRDERWWDEPERFVPNRFETDQPRHSFAYFPFGVGPRRCPGEEFTLAASKVVLGELLSAFSFERDTNTDQLGDRPAGVLNSPVYLRPRRRE